MAVCQSVELRHFVNELLPPHVSVCDIALRNVPERIAALHLYAGVILADLVLLSRSRKDTDAAFKQEHKGDDNNNDQQDGLPLHRQRVRPLMRGMIGTPGNFMVVCTPHCNPSRANICLFFIYTIHCKQMFVNEIRTNFRNARLLF